MVLPAHIALLPAAGEIVLFDRSWYNRAGVEAPWYVVDSADKRRARINMIAHLLSSVEYHDVRAAAAACRAARKSRGYLRAPMESQTFVPDHAASLARGWPHR